MNQPRLSRRAMLRNAILLGTASALAPAALPRALAAPAAPTDAGKSPPMTPESMAALDAALGKKGCYVEAEGVYTTGLPRNDLKITIKGEPVPIPLGFAAGCPWSEPWTAKAPCS